MFRVASRARPGFRRRLTRMTRRLRCSAARLSGRPKRLHYRVRDLEAQGISRHVIQRLIEKGRIRTKKNGRQLYLNTEDVEREFGFGGGPAPQPSPSALRWAREMLGQ